MNLDLVKELQKYEKERQDLINAVNQAQQRVNEIQTQLIRREGIIAWMKESLQEEAQKKVPIKKGNIKAQKEALMARAKKEVDKAQKTEKGEGKPAETGN
ncbi:hypothetical protein LCGC14_0371490 [marine sediment metagenome]|uniref:Uncharacterized protein n=1 Tax=marine sediment metagenome TaxID=412755 RepID=A0A0F9TMZ8_9ZZZZ